MRLVQPHEGEALRAITRSCPGTGCMLETDWLLKNENAAMPWNVYFVGEAAAIRVSSQGGRGVLCGDVQNMDELETFLRFAGVQRLMAEQVPDGWHVAGNKLLMARPAEKAEHTAALPCCSPMEDGLCLQRAAELSKVLEVLESTDGPLQPEEVRNGFFADNAARRNHGLAAFYGVQLGEGLLSTGGMYAITSVEAHLACLETLPGMRRRGYAGYLVRSLCEDYAAHRISLFCADNMAGFYTRFGFEHTGRRMSISVKL